MKFIVECVSKNSGRLGNFVQQETGKIFQTPLLMQITKGGSVPYLARDVFDRVINETQLIQLSLATMIHMTDGLHHFQTCQQGGVAAYVGFHDYPTLLMVRDPCEQMPQGFNEKDTVPLFTRQGKHLLSAKRYMDLVEIFQPDFYQGLNDADTNKDSAKKRLKKSLDRTEEFMNYCYDRHQQQPKNFKDHSLLVPIVGGYCQHTRAQSIQHAITKTSTIGYIVGGYIFEGFHNYGLPATEITSKDEILSIMQYCINEMAEIQTTNVKPLVLPGAYTPIIMLELIRLGCDVFDTSYAYLAAINFKALTYCYKLNEKEQQQTTQLENGHGKENEAEVVEDKCNKLLPSPFIDVTDVRYKDDFTPLLSYCQCLACRKHTKGYLYHLYVTHELLGPILLMIHNLHHMIQFFQTIRTAIAQDRLAELIDLIKYQKSDQEIDYSIKEYIKAIVKVGFGKKIKT